MKVVSQICLAAEKLLRVCKNVKYVSQLGQLKGNDKMCLLSYNLTHIIPFRTDSFSFYLKQM